jgi:uncharacterized protein YkwD
VSRGQAAVLVDGGEMGRRNLVPLVVLVALTVGYQLLPRVLPAAPARVLEAGSERIGWVDPLETDDLARDIYARVNDERLERGLPPLAWHEGLGQLARAWSEEMIRTGYRHSSNEFRAHPDFVGTGENISMGYTSADEAHVGWMLSDGHRQNILSPQYTAVGIGIVCRNDGHMWATQIFGAAAGAPAPAAAPPAPEPIVRRDRGASCPMTGRGGSVFESYSP